MNEYHDPPDPPEELRPCPFCGKWAKESIRTDSNGGSVAYEVYCQDCDVGMENWSRAVLAERWNKRPVWERQNIQGVAIELKLPTETIHNG